MDDPFFYLSLVQNALKESRKEVPQDKLEMSGQN
jgi:hypothetical protein